MLDANTDSDFRSAEAKPLVYEHAKAVAALNRR